MKPNPVSLLVSRRLFVAPPSVLSSILLGSVLFTVTGCDYLEKKANEQLQEELKKDSKKKLDDADDKDEKAAKASGGKPAESASPSGTASDGLQWADASGGTSKMTRVAIDAGGLSGLSMLAPEGATVKASLGGRGADVAQFGAGFAVWVTEDPTVTLPLMKEAASARFGKDAKIEHEDANSIIIGGKSPLGDAFFAYQGFFKANGKLYRCETEASQAGSTKAHAEAIDRACESLELGGKSIGSGASAAPAEKLAEEPAPAPSAPEKPATAAANTPAAQTAPSKPAAAAPAKPTAPAPTTPAKAAPPPPPSAAPAAAPRPAPDKKKTRTLKK